MVCSTTGRRPNKLYGYNLDLPQYKQLKSILKDVLVQLVESGVTDFICGGALGWDTLFFYSVDELKDIYPNIKITLAVPFEKQDCKWIYESRLIYKLMKEKADKIIYVDSLREYATIGVPVGEYHFKKLNTRNEYMVDHSDIVLSCWEGLKEGGTYNALRYAKKLNLPIININPSNYGVTKIV